MIATPIHPQIMDLVNLSTTDSSKIFFSYQETCNHFLNTFISERLIRNESLLITVEKLEDIHFLNNKSSQFNPFLHLHNKNTLAIQTVSKIRVRAKKNPKLLHQINYEQLENQLNALLHDVHLAYQENYGQDDNSIKLSSLLQHLLNSKIDYQAPILEYYLPEYLFDYSQIEFSKIQGLIDWASQAYKQKFRAFTRVLSKASSEVSHENYLSIIGKQLSKANELCILFLNNLNEYKELQSQALEEKKNVAYKLLSRIRNIRDKGERIHKEYIGSRSTTFLSKLTSSVKTSQLNASFQESLEIEFDNCLECFKENFPSLYQEFYMIEESILEPNVFNAEKILNKEVQRIEAQYHQSKHARLEQLNLHNCPDIFKSIIQELNTFYVEIQETELIPFDPSDKSFNLINNYEFLLNIRHSLHEMHQIIYYNPDYYAWLQKLEECSEKESLLLDTFIQFFTNTEEWSDIFESYYFHSSIKAKHKHTIGLEKKLVDINALKKQLDELSNGFIDCICNKHFFQFIDFLKSNQPEVYKTYFKKKYSAHHEHFANGGDLDILKRFFPITVIARKDFDCIHQEANWDYHLHLDSSKFETNKLSVPRFAAKYVYAKYPVDEFYLSENLKQEDTFWIKHDMKEYIKHPKLQTDQDQLNFARSLSSKLDTYLHRIQIFQIEGHYIISFLDKKVLGIFLHFYEKYTIKKFVIDHDLNYSLSDILLAGVDNITVLIQDHLLDPYDYESCQWQRYVIELMQRAGLATKDISYSHIVNKNYEQLQIPIQAKYSVDQKELESTDSVVEEIK